VTDPPACVVSSEGEVLRIRVKAVAGSRQSGIAGLLGDRLKVRVSAPPEAGRANDAVRQLLASSFGVAGRDVLLVSGAASRDKVLDIRGEPIALAVRLKTILADEHRS
jgi:uncharacterized protein (TIGR00251 family)